jgi:integrase
LRPNTQLGYEWRLTKHLLPLFCDMTIADIDVDVVDRYREAKVAERERVREAAESGNPLTRRDGQKRVALSNESINKTLVLLANILDNAVERGGLGSNPARGNRRRLKAPRPQRRVLEPDELTELLQIAGKMDRQKAAGPADRTAADDGRDGAGRAQSHRALPASVAGC